MVKKNSLISEFKKFDFFSTSIGFRQNGAESFGSVFGTCISLIIAIVIALYGVNKFVIMSNYDDTQFNEYVVKNGLSETSFS